MARKQDRMEGYARQHRAHRRWGLLVRMSAVAVALCTVSALVLPALTMEAEKAAYCGNQAHTHSAECYTKKTVCGLEEVTQPALVCTVPEGHTHTDACREKTLICTVAEGHTHAPECYQTVEELTCTLAEDETHTHTEGCYARHEELVCTQPEGHVHTEECYEQHLVCTLPENHTHADGCYAPVPSDAHTHTEACYQQELTCPLPEHTHTLACYSDPTADKEASADWEATLPAEKTGVWAWDLVAVAQSQLGYAESEKNYEVQPDGVTTLGYTRYGDWYGIPYGDWCAMFVSFCLNYAGVPRESMPIESSVPRWVEMLAQQGQLYTLADRDPRPGDLMFVDGDGDEAPEHMGIVEEYGENLVVIEGNTSSNVVERVTYRRDTDLAMVFAPCPVNPEDLTTASFEGEDFSVQAVYSSEAKIPADAQLRASEYPADSETYRRRVEQMQEQYGLTPEESEKIRLFNIGFYQGDAEVEPSAPVEVTLTYADNARDVGCSVAHFGEELEQVPAEATVANGMRTLRFTLGSFSDVAVMPLIGDITGGKFALVSRNTITGGHVALMPTRRDNAHLSGEVVSATFKKSTSGGSFPDYAAVLGSEAEVTAFMKDQMIWNFSRGGNPWSGYYYRVSADVNGTDHYLRVDGTSLTTTTATSRATHFDIEVVGEFIALKVQGQNRYVNKTGNADAMFGTYQNQSDQNNHFYLVSSAKTVNTVAGETPTGTVINLFDYWRDKRIGDGNGSQKTGINQNHPLRFVGAGDTPANQWTGSGGGARQGIVGDRLVDGYPVLSGDQSLFRGEANSDESLAYLFDPKADTEHRQVFENVGNLLQVNDQGYYYYDSTQNYAYFDEQEQRFTLYDQPMPDTKGEFFPFTDFNEFTDVGQRNFFFGLTLTTRFINRYNGYADSSQRHPMTFKFSGDDDVWIFVDDVLVADLGGIHDAVDVTIDFAKGLVNINKVGLGGNNNTPLPQTKKFSEIFKDSGVKLNENGILENNSYHTLKFFYLERGAGNSNMKLEYNLATIPTTGVYKTDQQGDPIAGAKFAVYAAQKDEKGEYQYKSSLTGGVVPRDQIPAEPTYNTDGDILGANGKVLINALYSGTTDYRGEMIFRDSYGGALSLQEMKDMFGERFILREIGVPDGYRLVDVDSNMYIQNNTLLTGDTYKSGVYNATTELLTAPNTLYLIERKGHNYDGAKDHYDINGDKVQAGSQDVTYAELDYYTETSNAKGTLFAVVQKFAVGNEAVWDQMQDDKNWQPIWGSGADGYTAVEHQGGVESLLNAAIEAAKKQKGVAFGNGSEFKPAASGAMELELKNLPGEPQDYYWYLVNNGGLKPDDPADQLQLAQRTRFTVALYWTKGELANADASNTWQVSAENHPVGKIRPFTRAFGANIEVPNITNRMMLQKLDRDDKGVNGAVFAMYPAGTDGGKLYYKGTDGERIVLNEDGSALMLNGDVLGAYTVDPQSGAITVDIGNAHYDIRPQTDFSGSPIVKTTAPKEGVMAQHQSGVLDLEGMPNGNFVLREIKAPEGYLINPAQIMVKVDDYGIYVNAGDEKDDVSVSLGPGALISSMKHLASAGEVDRTLFWIYSVIKANVTEADTFDFSTTVTGGKDNWKYLDKDGHILDAPDVEAAVKAGAMRNYMEYEPKPQGLQNYKIHDHIYNTPDPGMNQDGMVPDILLKAEQGWTALVIRQDYDHGLKHKQGVFADEDPGDYTYDNLEQQSISKLFSLAKLVQVKDQRTSSLSIEKQVVNPQPDTPEFRFDITLTTGTEKTPVVGTFPMTRTMGDVVTEETITFTNGQANVHLRDGEKVLISGLPESASYTVTEVENASYAPSYTVESEAKQDGGTATGTLVWDSTNNDYTTDLVFTNTYQTTITLVKHDAMADQTKLPGAKFTLQNEAGHYYQANGGFDVEPAELTTDQDGKINFVNLGDGTYTLTETKAPDGYARLTHPVTIVVKDAKITAVADGTQTSYKFENTVLYLPNSAGMVLPQTGGVGTTGITTLGLGLLILAGAILLVQKRKGAVSKS